jgi:hypothetical protein
MNSPINIGIKDKALPKLATLIRRTTGGLTRRTRPELESVYQRIFDRDLDQIGATNNFYPVANAANYSLLYLILRMMREFSFSSIVELGAGQTSLLFDELRRRGLTDANTLTIEHDQEWAQHVQTRVSHEVKVVELIQYKDKGLAYYGYDFSDIAFKSEIDLLIVDGPPAWKRDWTYARHCCLQLLDRLDPSGFIIVLDDTERKGEAVLCDKVAEMLQSRNIIFKRGFIAANKRQAVFASGRFSHVAFY